MDDLIELWRTGLTPAFLGKPDIEINEFLLDFGATLGNQNTILKEVYWSYLHGEASYEYRPLIGAPFQFEFNTVQENVLLKRLDKQYLLTENQFQRYMGLIDLIFSEVYPLGSVVELDQEKLPGEIKELFKNKRPELLVLLHARRVPSKDDKNYIDYVASVWPFGLMEDVTPLLINNMLVKRVVSAGLTNDEEKQFVNQVLKRELVAKKQISIMYTNQDGRWSYEN
ncbi:DUF4176 domain-containing protein [Liquorilactobacillus hordei]|uniref:DUF4176 domain-containing protein n=1 Tax=Liquorilactobacillus hordei TaxID=468911 RepID=A0A3Q8CJN0_9LACO|nr:DUF4176 domain-containing protein [Liquorilactobacillus hordei]AUJ29044.1 hypothetical protein BSQ49_01755 [Liquorilactobacillus hordei]